MNVLRTTFLMALLTVVFVIVGRLLGGQSGMIMAFVFAVAMNGFSYWFSDKMVLKMYGAREVSEADAPELHSIVRNLATRAHLPMPKVYMIDSPQPNAFATGRNPEHAAVAVTSGIMGILDREELSGVLGHELAHVEHRDILIGTIAATMAGAISMLAQWAMFFGGGRNERDNPLGFVGTLAMMILAPMAAILIQMAISRSREFGADAGGAAICGNPLWLARALRKLEAGAKRIPMNANPATAHMFIVSPLTGGGMMSLFSTHPPMEARIERLEAMARVRG